MRITQMYSRFGWMHKRTLMKKYGLKNVFSQTEPCLFFGMYGDKQIEDALNWKAPIVIWLSGGDAAYLRNKLQYIETFKKKKDVTFIATVNFIEKDLQMMGFIYKKIPLFSHNIDDFKPSQLGKSIYIYKPGSPIYCGWNVVNRIKQEFPNIPIIEARNHHVYSQQQMQEIYNKSFLGIRLTKHDGLAHSAAELGLSGRKIIWRGDTPNSVRWENHDDVLIQIETIIRNKYNPFNLAKKVRNYLDVGDSWLNV